MLFPLTLDYSSDLIEFDESVPKIFHNFGNEYKKNIELISFVFSLNVHKLCAIGSVSNSKSCLYFMSVKHRNSKHEKKLLKKSHSKLKTASIFFYKLQHYIKLMFIFSKHNLAKICEF